MFLATFIDQPLVIEADGRPVPPEIGTFGVTEGPVIVPGIDVIEAAGLVDSFAEHLSLEAMYDESLPAKYKAVLLFEVDEQTGEPVSLTGRNLL